MFLDSAALEAIDIGLTVVMKLVDEPIVREDESCHVGQGVLALGVLDFLRIVEQARYQVAVLFIVNIFAFGKLKEF